MPVGPLQSLTVSALGYLQRVDGVLGGNPATLIQQLPIPLTAIPNLQAVIPQLNLPMGTAGSLPNLGSVLSGAKGGIVIPNPLPSAIASAGSKRAEGAGQPATSRRRSRPSACRRPARRVLPCRRLP